jgi:hypothetical protein
MPRACCDRARWGTVTGDAATHSVVARYALKVRFTRNITRRKRKPASRAAAPLARRKTGVCRRGSPGWKPTARPRHSPTTSSRAHTTPRYPRVGLGVDARRRRDGVAGEPVTKRELDVRTHAVGTARRRAEARQHSLRQPALHASGGHGDDVRRDGSASGSARIWPSASTSASARSAVWM